MNDSEIEELVNKSPIPHADVAFQHDSRSHSHWRTSQAAYTTMLGLLSVGLLTAMGHHRFYSYLNGRQIEDSVSQAWAIRICNAFAYLFKTAFVAAVAVAYAQGFWVFERRKSLARQVFWSSIQSTLICQYRFVSTYNSTFWVCNSVLASTTCCSTFPWDIDRLFTPFG